ncbi:polysaccharide lyase [Allokutzneria oryzae]|uniref:Polysaccharide lyase n=1 Tax=Allokutzneria oryzae TaxID=1378989 RepID=A0ABV5ZZS0_9PSEU
MKRHSTLAIAIAAAVAASAAVVTGTGAAAPLALDWESAQQHTMPGGPPPGWAKEYDPSVRHENGEPQARTATAPEPVRAGGHAARFELRKDDPVINNGARAELSHDFRTGEQWYGFSTYLKDWAPDQAPDIVTQWHQHWEVGSSPPLSINTRKGGWEISQNWEGHSEQTPVGPYESNKWTDWVVHVKWSAGADGVLRIWKDGKPVPGFENRTGRNNYDDDRGNYMKVGIYKWPWSQGRPSDTDTRVLYHDETRIAGADGSYEAVAPGGGSATPRDEVDPVDGVRMIHPSKPGGPSSATTPATGSA